MHPHPPPKGYRPFTDRAALERDFAAFLVNVRPVQAALLPIGARVPPIVTLAADAALRDLVRLHATDIAPGDGGDVVTDSRVMADAPRGRAKVAIRFRWSNPAVYEMTTVWRLPKHTDWLLSALHHGGAWCQPAPLDPYRPAIWLPLNTEELLPHVITTCAMLVAAERNRRAA